MIREKLQSAWNWTKDKARRFWKWGVAIVIGGVVLAAVIPPANVSFENLPNVAKEAGIYRITFDQYSDVEIKDQDMPEVLLRKWGDETYIKVSYPDFTPVNLKQDKGKLKWKNGNKEVHLYPLEPTEQMEGGGFEFEIILKEKPATNKIVLNIESKGLNFYYQSALTGEYQNGYSEEFQKEIVVSETQIKDLDGNVLVERSENIIGSYAVYHESKSGNYEAFPNGKNYMAGKAFHIYRPQMIDANGWKVWGELHYDKQAGTLTTTIPQDFIDNAVYPIRHAAGETFGYTTLGGSNHNTDSIIGNASTGAAGTVQKISVGMQWAGTIATKCAIYLDSDKSFIDETEERTDIGNTSAFYDFDFGTDPTISAVDYWLVVWSNTNFFRKYDSEADRPYSAEDPEPYGTFPDPLNPIQGGRKYSIYATYTPANGVERRDIYIE